MSSPKSTSEFASGFTLALNYQKIAFRNLSKNKFTTLLNAVGLTIGISCFIFISLYVYSEYSYDRHFTDSDRIFRVTMNWRSNADKNDVRIGMSLSSVAGQLQEEFSEVESATGIIPFTQQAVVKVDEKFFYEDNYFETDMSFFSVFNVTPLQGNLENIDEQSSIVITQKLAARYFGSEDPLEQTLIVNDVPYEIVAVLPDVPANSSLQYEALIFSFTDITADWSFTFFKVLPKVSAVSDLAKRINELFVNEYDQYLLKTASVGVYEIEPLRDIHFGQPKLYDKAKGNLSMLYLLTGIALLILTVSCINYLNLCMALTSTRQIEVGIRKIFGARHSHTWVQYAAEFFILACFCLTLSVLLIAVLWPTIISNANIQLVLSVQGLIAVGLGLLLVLVVLSLITGAYVASQFSAGSPIYNLKQRVGVKSSRLFRNSLLVFQYTVSLALVFSSFIVMHQMDIMSGSASTMNLDQIMVINLPKDEDSRPSLEQFKAAVTKLPFVENISFTGHRSLPTQEPEFEIFGVDTDNGQVIKTLAYVRVDENFFNTLNVPIISGRSYTQSEIDSAGDWNFPIVNEAFVKSQGWKDDPLQHSIAYGEHKDEKRKILAVVSDFGFSGFHRKAQPMVFFPNNRYADKIMIHISSFNENKMSELQALWTRELNVPFDFKFLDDYFAEVLAKEKDLQQILFGFSILAVVIGGLGLLGIININLSQQRKATAIRMIYGAGMAHLLSLTWKEYLGLFLLAIVIAYPISLAILSEWLQGFPEKAPISVVEYLKAISVISLLVIFTMGYHAIQIRTAKHIKWIRHD